jgi:sulfite reductase (ferredoxin)
LCGDVQSGHAQILYQITLSAARMLLITRAVEARSESDVFAQFRRCFIETRLIDSKYLPLIETAEKKDFAFVEARAEDVLSLAEGVEELYGSMDNSLRFGGDASRSPEPKL